MTGWENPDVELLYGINGLAERTPGWVDRLLGHLGEYGTVGALLLMCAWAWWIARRRADAVPAVAGLLWALLAAGTALLVNVPIRGFVERPRPFEEHQGLDVLVGGKGDFSFVSDHAALAMALAVGIFMVDRGIGLLGIAAALFTAFCRVYLGVHYPTDVVGGLALGTAVVLLLAPAALALLTPPLRAAAASRRAGWLVQAPGAAAGRERVEQEVRREYDRGLAA